MALVVAAVGQDGRPKKGRKASAIIAADDGLCYTSDQRLSPHCYVG